MARRPPKPPKLPPPTVRQCWGQFLKWALGVPVVIAVGLAIIGGALWLMGGQDLMWRTTSDMGTALLYIAGIVLMYPLLLLLWVAELRAGLRAARDWEAMPPEARAVALAAAPSSQRRKGG
jgi:hypothetical protein